MGTPSPAGVTNVGPTEGMTLRQLATFLADCYRSPAPVDQDAPLQVRSSLTGRLRSITAPLQPCTCPWQRVASHSPHHPACAHRGVVTS